MSIFDDIEKAIPDEKTRERYYNSAAFRMDMEDFREHGTRFCRQCGWRSDMKAYCYTCEPCEVCQYLRFKCRCESERYQKHLRDLLNERQERRS